MKKLLIKKAKLEELNKIKEEKKKAKEDLKKAKDEQKILKEELKKAKEELKKSKEAKTPKKTKFIKYINLENEENTIIEPLSQEVCCEMLKNGNQCSKNIYLENLCKRHYNLKNKENTENTCEK